MEQRRNEGAGRRGRSRVGPSTGDIVWHDCNMRKSGRDSAGNRARSHMLDIYLKLVDRGGVVDRLLSSRLGEPRSIPGGVAPGFSCLKMPLKRLLMAGSPISSRIPESTGELLYNRDHSAADRRRNSTPAHPRAVTTCFASEFCGTKRTMVRCRGAPGCPEFNPAEEITLLTCSFSAVRRSCRLTKSNCSFGYLLLVKNITCSQIAEKAYHGNKPIVCSVRDQWNFSHFRGNLFKRVGWTLAGVEVEMEQQNAVTGANPLAYDNVRQHAKIQGSDYSPLTSANRVRFPACSLPDFRTWEMCRMMLLVGGFSRGSPVSPPLHCGAASSAPHFILIGSQDLDGWLVSRVACVAAPVFTPSGSVESRALEGVTCGLQLGGGRGEEVAAERRDGWRTGSITETEKGVLRGRR
ncbi:hypothetical protein PR048_019895 [Dryococelus australis]|uniref:Uncharacterized protein n=1 Tax=Dryococelus australis TaxID=614101 RepID=A0ABQ9H4S1_9NEOP|nr:hypothetical protein PR048_019895 [Dryococelus australis]